jgi:hypothetical protein
MPPKRSSSSAPLGARVQQMLVSSTNSVITRVHRSRNQRKEDIAAEAATNSTPRPNTGMGGTTLSADTERRDYFGNATINPPPTTARNAQPTRPGIIHRVSAFEEDPDAIEPSAASTPRMVSRGSRWRTKTATPKLPKTGYLPARTFTIIAPGSLTSKFLILGLLAIVFQISLIVLYRKFIHKRALWRSAVPFGSWCDIGKTPDKRSRVDDFFMLNALFGSLTFTQAKAFDIAWNFAVGRIGQIIMAWLSYRAISSSMYLIMEQQPLPYSLFQRATFSWPTFRIIPSVLKALLTKLSLHNRGMLVLVLLDIIYISVFPTLINATGGYVPLTRTQVRIRNDSRQGALMSMKEFYTEAVPSYIVHEIGQQAGRYNIVPNYLMYYLDGTAFGNTSYVDAFNAINKGIMRLPLFGLYFENRLTECVFRFSVSAQRFHKLPYLQIPQPGLSQQDIQRRPTFSGLYPPAYA